MFKWLFNKPVEVKTPQPQAKTSLFSTHEFDFPAKRFDLVERVFQLKREQPIFHGDYAQDDSSDGFPQFKTYNAMANTVSDAVVGWYATQGFIGAQLCGILAQNWLINKACSMPGDDAIRKGYNIVSIDGDELPPEAIKIMKRYDRSMRLTWNMREFIRKGRIFGIRVAMFKVMSTDPDYYEKPFNIDGVTPGSYKGIVQVDPYWTAPMLDGAAASQPDTLHFYEPTWWIINGKKIHRSHLIIFRHAEPVDVLKPSYIYGGVPLSQQIMERVYAAERTANEAPQLAMTKRTTVWLTDMEAVMANSDAAVERLQQWAQYRDNFGVKLGDKEGDEFSQFDTSLADMDALIMTQYQLVAAIAGVPATKLIGTSPKGFNASGEYEEASYHELLESIQTHDLTPLAERHHQLVMKSFVESQLKLKLNIQTTLNWLPLDTPTAAELAATNLTKAQTSQILIQSGALSSEDERQRIATDKDSGYNELGILDENPDNFEDGEPDEETPDQPEKEDDKPVPKEIVKAEDADHWITLNAKKKGTPEGKAGSHVLLNGEGEVVGGAGGKLNGKKLGNVKSKGAAVSGKTEGGSTEPATPPAAAEAPTTTEAPAAKTEAPKETPVEAPKEAPKNAIQAPPAEAPKVETNLETFRRKSITEANALSASAQTPEEHRAAASAHARAANNIGKTDRELWQQHVDKYNEHKKAFSKAKALAKSTAKKAQKASAEASPEAGKYGDVESKFAKVDSTEINKQLTDQFGLKFENGAKLKPRDANSPESAQEPQSNLLRSNRQLNVNENTVAAKRVRKVLGHVNDTLSSLTDAGYDIKSALSNANVAFGASAPKKGCNGYSWQKNGVGLFSVNYRDASDRIEQQQRTERRKAAGEVRWSVSSTSENPMRATIIHEMAHALGMQSNINSPKKLKDILLGLHNEGKLTTPPNLTEQELRTYNASRNKIGWWVKHNISEYAAGDIHETDAELAAMVTSPDYKRGTLPVELENHIDELFKKVK